MREVMINGYRTFGHEGVGTVTRIGDGVQK